MGPAKILLCALAAVPSLFSPLAAAAADKKDGLASESIDNTQQFVANLTEQKGGWVEPGVCAGRFCVYGNRYLAGGRGVAVVTSSKNRIQVDRTENWLKKASNWAPREPPFEIKELEDGRKAYVANATIKRGTNLLMFTPVLIVHKEFFDEVRKAEDQDRVLDAAVKLLPWATRQKFNAQRVEKSTGHKVKDIIKARPFEIDLGYESSPTEQSKEKHHLSYPEAAYFGQDCRPNVAFYIDPFLGHRTVAARKIVPGDELTIHLTDPFLPRVARQGQFRRLSGHECTCKQCTADGDQEAVKKSDARLREIKRIEASLKDHSSTDVTVAMIERLIELYKTERLQSKLTDPYMLAALNYNYLGHHKEAVKYAHLANQAGIIEQGPESVDALQMRILASDPKGHYSWNQKDKYKGPGVGKRN